jgi:molybdate transport system substrate-binding protein
VDLAKSGIFVAVREGESAPDIGAEAALKRAVEAARTVGYSTGPSGVYLEKLFARWGVTEALKQRIVRAPPGVPVGSLVAEGKVALGFQQLSELMHVKGIQVIGPLPADIQLITTFSAGVSLTCARGEAARAALGYMASPAADAAKKRNGMERA